MQAVNSCPVRGVEVCLLDTARKAMDDAVRECRPPAGAALPVGKPRYHLRYLRRRLVTALRGRDWVPMDVALQGALEPCTSLEEGRQLVFSMHKEKALLLKKVGQLCEIRLPS